METRFSRAICTYDGSQLRSHFIRQFAGIKGDGIVAFRGPADVEIESMVDLEDHIPIKAASMLHFVGEFFLLDIKAMNIYLRLFISIITDVLNDWPGNYPEFKIVRDGDDLYVAFSAKRKKLSVAIVTATPISSLFHVGLNIDDKGSPAEVGTIDLESIFDDQDIDVLAHHLLTRFRTEMCSIDSAIRKVETR